MYIPNQIVFDFKTNSPRKIIDPWSIDLSVDRSTHFVKLNSPTEAFLPQSISEALELIEKHEIAPAHSKECLDSNKFWYNRICTKECVDR